MAVTAQIRLSWRGRALSISSFLSPARCPPHIVKLPREPPPLVILQVKEVSRHPLQFLFGPLELSDVYCGADITGKRAIRREARHPCIQNPTVFAVMPPEPYSMRKVWRPANAVR
jgi:hypothetical protein